jgi:hypothetical protein
LQWTRSELVSAVDQKVTFDQDITVDPAEFAGNPRILRAENVHADGEAGMMRKRISSKPLCM